MKTLVFPYECARFIDDDGGAGYILDVISNKSMCRVSYDNGGIKVVSSESIKPEGGMAK